MSAERTADERDPHIIIADQFRFHDFSVSGTSHWVEKSALGQSRTRRGNFGLTLVYLGVGMLVVGIVYHIQFMLGLRHERDEMKDHEYYPRPEQVSSLLHLAGCGCAAAGRHHRAAANLTFNIGPFR